MKFHYNLIKLECDWLKFVDSLNDSNRFYLDKPVKGAIKNIYEIDFNVKSSSSNEKKYKTVANNAFRNFQIRSLSLKNLGLEFVDEDAFEKKSFEDNLESLDLSGNSLKRIDAITLKNLKRLEKLNLASNQITLESGNFRHNRNLIRLDLSTNQIQFLAPNTFDQVNQLKLLNLSNNGLRSINACLFMEIQTSTISMKYSPPLIDLTKNPIVCDCGMFYLNRVNNYRIDAACIGPIEYKNRTFKDLHLEDPSALCKYSKMSSDCDQTKGYFGLLVSVIVLSILSCFLCIISCCCCCKLMSLQDRFGKFKTAVRQATSRNSSPPRQYYVNTLNINDREKLIK
jgi:hypothetical protein